MMNCACGEADNSRRQLIGDNSTFAAERVIDWKGEYQSIGSLYCILLFEKEKSINRVITGVNYNEKENIE